MITQHLNIDRNSQKQPPPPPPPLPPPPPPPSLVNPFHLLSLECLFDLARVFKFLRLVPKILVIKLLVKPPAVCKGL